MVSVDSRDFQSDILNFSKAIYLLYIHTNYIIYRSDSSPVSGNFGQCLRCGLLPLDKGKPGPDRENESTSLRTVGEMVVGNTILGTYKPCIPGIECS